MALQAGVTLVKPSLRELRELLQQPLASLPEQSQAAQSLVLRGAADMVALSMGEDGAMLATRATGSLRLIFQRWPASRKQSTSPVRPPPK